jgi:phospholipid transport system substrate-binding protein
MHGFGLKGIRYLALSAVAALSLVGSARAETATQVIDKLNTTLVDVLRDGETLGFKGRAEKLRPVLLQSYDLDAMGRVAVGRAWDQATPEQRKALSEAFQRFTVDNYASRFKGGPNSPKFEMLGERNGSQGTIVSTQIVRTDKPPVKIDYVMRQRGDSFRVVDVFLDSAISEVATRRSEFTSILARSGFDGLVDSLRAGSERLERETDS